MITFDDFCEAQETVSTLIFWNSDYGKQPKYKGKADVDQYIMNARNGYGYCYLIDAMNVEDAKNKIASVQQTTIRNVSVYGANAIAAITKLGGKVIH